LVDAGESPRAESLRRGIGKGKGREEGVCDENWWTESEMFESFKKSRIRLRKSVITVLRNRKEEEGKSRKAYIRYSRMKLYTMANEPTIAHCGSRPAP
jgi:hypothetical protein